MGLPLFHDPTPHCIKTHLCFVLFLSPVHLQIWHLHLKHVILKQPATAHKYLSGLGVIETYSGNIFNIKSNSHTWQGCGINRVSARNIISLWTDKQMFSISSNCKWVLEKREHIYIYINTLSLWFSFGYMQSWEIYYLFKVRKYFHDSPNVVFSKRHTQEISPPRHLYKHETRKHKHDFNKPLGKL